MYCKYCGKEIDEDSKFCNHCGRQLDNKNVLSSFIPSNVPTQIKVYLCLFIIWVFVTFAITQGWLYGFFASAFLLPLSMFCILYLFNKLGKYSLNLIWNDNDSKKTKMWKCVYYIASLCIIILVLSDSSVKYWNDYKYEDASKMSLEQLFGVTSVVWGLGTFMIYIAIVFMRIKKNYNITN